MYITSQPKGADRKHKTDREKMEKRSESEKVSRKHSALIMLELSLLLPVVLGNGLRLLSLLNDSVTGETAE